MIGTIGVVFLVVIILTTFMFFSLKRIVSKVSEETKVYFVMKLQSYDELIEEKEKKLAELASNEVELKENIENLTAEELKEVIIAKEPPKYQYEGLGDIIKQIEKDFNYNYFEIIKKFLMVSQKYDSNNYNNALKIKKIILNKGIYNFIIKKEHEQIKMMKEYNIDQTLVYKEYFKQYKKFNINNFLKLVDVFIIKNDPHIYITTGSNNTDFNDLNDLIVTNTNKNIIKGIKILYRGKIYDYSLS